MKKRIPMDFPDVLIRVETRDLTGKLISAFLANYSRPEDRLKIAQAANAAYPAGNALVTFPIPKVA